MKIIDITENLKRLIQTHLPFIFSSLEVLDRIELVKKYLRKIGKIVKWKRNSKGNKDNGDNNKGDCHYSYIEENEKRRITKKLELTNVPYEQIASLISRLENKPLDNPSLESSQNEKEKNTAPKTKRRKNKGPTTKKKKRKPCSHGRK